MLRGDELNSFGKRAERHSCDSAGDGTTGAEFAKSGGSRPDLVDILVRALDRLGPESARESPRHHHHRRQPHERAERRYRLRRAAGESSGVARTLASTLGFVAQNSTPSPPPRPPLAPWRSRSAPARPQPSS
jgi:hypothetical protein